MKLLITLAVLIFVSITGHAATVKIRTVKTLGPMKHKVIYQSRDLKKVQGTNLLKGKLVTQWGTQVFEVVTGYYKCDSYKVCTLTDYDRHASFEKCAVKRNRVECSKPISSKFESDSKDVVITSNSNDLSYDEYGNNSSSNYGNDDEFTVNVDNEFGNYGDLY